ncbi:replication initiator protein A [Azospirillum doebereinerae]|uniref:replication initiator protein A n=1 Tax=Azospirillum doebereinerae TaxID=92933 RepID=UPI001EE5B3F2|nr:replication initiator protein A [Azospirillum doebereinerae]MCG5238375.1 replication initiator protein A [Azospirillum doebereinerae]
MTRPPEGERQQLEFDLLFDALPDIALRDQRDAMERPLVALGKNRRTDPIEYQFDDDLFVRVLPHQEYGQATIWDYDVILYLLGQINERAERGDLPTVPAISVAPHQLLTAIRRVPKGGRPGGADYRELRAAIARLQTTIVETNIWQGKKLRRFKRFSLIHDFTEDDPGERSSGGMTFVLPAWMVDSIRNRRGILSIHPDYFDLSSGFDRFLYRVARKYAGRQPDGARIGMTKLHEKSGSPMRKSDFALQIRKAVTRNTLPEYDLRLTRSASDEVLRMRPRSLSQLPEGAAQSRANETPLEDANDTPLLCE